MFLKKQLLLLLSERLSEEMATGEDLRLLHIHGHVLFGSVEEDIILMVEVLKVFIENPTKTSSFPCVSFYRVRKLVLIKPTELYTRNSSVENNYFQWSMAVKLETTQDLSSSVKALSLINMHLFIMI